VFGFADTRKESSGEGFVRFFLLAIDDDRSPVLEAVPMNADVTITKKSLLNAPQAGFYRMQVGSFEIVALNDGTFGFNAEDQLTHVQPGEVERVLRRASVHLPVGANVNAFLIHFRNPFWV
jgi:hypothetical protein